MNKILFAIKNPIKTIKIITNKLLLNMNGLLGRDITDKWERCYINFEKIKYEELDMYQKSHYKRYLFATNYIIQSDIIGDLACWTGYWSAMISEKWYIVHWFDISKKVILHNKDKYINANNLSFYQYDILELKLENIYNKIISFETIEHIESNKIPSLFWIF